MKMPAAKSQQQVNGFGKRANGSDRLHGDNLKSKLANKKLDLMEQGNGEDKHANTQEMFHDTSAMGAHRKNRPQTDEEEPIVIYDTQSNTSIAQTARDQFAAALLRLQSGLDESASRLNAIEKRIDDLVGQQRKQARESQVKTTTRPSKLLSLTSSDRLNTLIYLSWPVLVFVAMRALEKRALLRKLA